MNFAVTDAVANSRNWSVGVIWKRVKFSAHNVTVKKCGENYRFLPLAQRRIKAEARRAAQLGEGFLGKPCGSSGLRIGDDSDFEKTYRNDESLT